MQQAQGSQGSGGATAVYRGLRGRRGMSAMGDINVTPLVDVVLVLLLVFMVTAPMMSRGIDVTSRVGGPAAGRIPRTASPVTVNARARSSVGDKPVNMVLL